MEYTKELWKTFKLLFIDREKLYTYEHNKIVDQILREEKELEDVFKTPEELECFKRFYIYESFYGYAFMFETKTGREKILKYLLNRGIIDNYIADKTSLTVVCPDGTNASMKILTAVLPELKHSIELRTRLRLGNCHIGSMKYIKKLKNPTSKLVTGFATGILPEHKYLHTWIEQTGRDGKEYVLDYTMNALLPKQEYYKYRQIDPSELTTITKEEFKRDMKVIAPLFRSEIVDVKQYLYFRHELMQDIENNNQAFQK